MKKYLTILLSLVPLWMSATTYYVQDTSMNVTYGSTASDANAGTNILLPWATWQKAFNTADAGDTVYFRGGVWSPTSKSYPGYAITQIDPGAGRGHNGTYSNPICFFAYPADYEAGNFPILDCNEASEVTTGNIGLSVNEATYLKFKGLTIRHVRMLNATANCSGVESINHTVSSVISWENMTVHNIGGTGYWLAGFDTLYVKNCDAYNICDSLDVNNPGGGAEGFNITGGGADADTFKVAYISGCRMWQCADEGIDLGLTKQFHIDSCWVWLGDRILEGEGGGIKIASSHVRLPEKRTIRNSILAYCVGGGIGAANFVEVDQGDVGCYYNNLIYKCDYGFRNSTGTYDCVNDASDLIIRNNIVYQVVTYVNLFTLCEDKSYITLDHNNWDIVESWPYHSYNYTITDADFVSLDTAQLRGARKIDGSLPDVTFGTLAAASGLLNYGTDTIIANSIILTGYHGAEPDLGPWEYEEAAEASEPLLYTVIPTTIASRWAIGGGNVTSDGGDTVIERGVCYSTSANPTTADVKITASGTTGSYSVTITGLTANTTYHVRAYAINGVGTGYGADVEFETRDWAIGKSGSVYVFSDGHIIKIE